MKRFLMALSLVFSVSIDATTKIEYKVEKITQPYQRAVKFLNNVDPVLQINETVASQFFDQFDLYKRKDKQRFE